VTEAPGTQLTNTARRIVAAGFALSGGAALIYEVVWTRELSLVFSSTVYAVSMMLAAFMAGLSLGGVLGGRRADSPKADPLTDLARLELGIAVFGVLSLVLIRALPAIQLVVLRQLQPPPGLFFGLQMLMAFLVMLAPTTLMGATFPLVSKISVADHASLGRTIGDLYSVNTLGAIAGSLAGGFLLIPLIGAKATILVAAALNLVVSFLVQSLSPKRLWSLLGAACALVVTAVVWLLLWPSPSFPLTFGTSRLFANYDEYQEMAERNRIIHEDENAYGRTVVIEDEFGGVRALIHGPLPEGADSTVDRSTTAILALLPHAYAPQARSGLVVGLGTGLTARSMLAMPLKTSTTVEIDPGMERAASYFVGGDLQADPRWTLVVADARQYLLVTPNDYDIITSEPSQPIASSVSPLFTREFYLLARERLTPTGVFCQWLPGYLLPEEDLEMMYKTLTSVFDDADVWSYEIDGQAAPDLFIVARMDGATVDTATIAGSVNHELARMGLPKSLVMPFPQFEELRRSITPETPVNTDDRPLLEFHVPWALVESFDDTPAPE
jgi:spermidine synthase